MVSEIDDEAAAVWPTDLDVSEWFPFGTDRIRLTYFPFNPQHSLRNQYSVYTSLPDRQLAANDCLGSRWGLRMHGNVLVVRHASRNLMRVTHLHSVEHQLIDHLVVRCAPLTQPPVSLRSAKFSFSHFEVQGMYLPYARHRSYSHPPSV